MIRHPVAYGRGSAAASAAGSVAAAATAGAAAITADLREPQPRNIAAFGSWPRKFATGAIAVGDA